MQDPERTTGIVLSCVGRAFLRARLGRCFCKKMNVYDMYRLGCDTRMVLSTRDARVCVFRWSWFPWGFPALHLPMSQARSGNDDSWPNSPNDSFYLTLQMSESSGVLPEVLPLRFLPFFSGNPSRSRAS